MVNPPAVTAAQMREVDRAMVEDFHIELVQMMENAGRNLAELALRRFAPRSTVVLAGSGGNGGGGLVAARHLANRGAEVHVALSRPEDELSDVTAHQLDIVRRLDIDTTDEPSNADLVIDAVIGYSLEGDPAGRVAELIEWANRQPAPVLSLDSPSGMDVSTGRAASPCVRANATMTLALPKVGLLMAPSLVGDLFVADISVPSALFERMGIDVRALFAEDTIVALTR
ncbi:MAG: NAD(P)H-hydrate epimerase [Microbacteriaceae bacterium]